jgi:hypothetical protein
MFTSNLFAFLDNISNKIPHSMWSHLSLIILVVLMMVEFDYCITINGVLNLTIVYQHNMVTIVYVMGSFVLDSIMAP